MDEATYYTISALLLVACVAAALSAWKARKRYLIAKARNDSLESVEK